MLYVSFIEIFFKSQLSFEDAGYLEGQAHALAALCFFSGIAIGNLLDYFVHWLEGKDGVAAHADGADLFLGVEAIKAGAGREAVPAYDEPAKKGATSGTVTMSGDSVLGGGLATSKQDGEGVLAMEVDGAAAEDEGKQKALVKMGMMTALAIGLHNFPEVRDRNHGRTLSLALTPALALALTLALTVTLPPTLVLAPTLTDPDSDPGRRASRPSWALLTTLLWVWAWQSPSVSTISLVGRGQITTYHHPTTHHHLSPSPLTLHSLPQPLVPRTSHPSPRTPHLSPRTSHPTAPHRTPEGLCVSIPIYYATKNRWQAFKWAFISGISEPIGAALGALASSEYQRIPADSPLTPNLHVALPPSPN